MLTIVGTKNCIWCVRVKDILSDHNIPFEVVSIPEKLSPMEFHELANKHEMSKTVPKIFDGNQLIGGYDELMEWIENHSGGYGEHF